MKRRSLISVAILGLVSVVLLGLVLGLDGCTPRLPERHVIPEEGISADIPLRLGDVVYLTTSIKGFPVGNTGGLMNPYPPWSETIRLPLRLARGPLTPDEANLLTAFLATGASNFAPDSSVPGVLEATRNQLWDAVVTSLVLGAHNGQQPAQLQIDMKKFCPKFKTIATGQEAVLSSSFFAECAEAANSARELRRVEPLVSQLAPVTAASSNLPNSGFYTNLTVVVSVARVERAGTTMRERSGQEARWSLADWQAAGICVDKEGTALSIVDVTLREGPLYSLRIVPADGMPRFVIRLDSSGERTVAALEGQWGTLSAESLEYLTARDVSRVYWGRPPQVDRRTELVPLTPAFRSACTP